MVCLLLLGVSSGLAYVSGEPAEEVVESIATVSHDFIKDHEDAAWLALLGGIACGLIGLVGLVVRAESSRQRMTYIGLAAVMGTYGLMAWTANLGGMVRHTEIRPGDGLSITFPEPHHEDD